jgi:acyl carrier protein
MSEPSLLRRELELSADFAPPENDTQDKIQSVFAYAFDIDHLGIDDDFFELGGDSLIAAQICSGVFDMLGIDIQPGLLTRHRTVRKLAGKLVSKSPRKLEFMVQIQDGQKDHPPLIILPGNDGYTALNPAFFAAFGPEHPVYTLQIPGLSGPTICPERIEDLAALFVQEVKLLRPRQGFHIISFCGGTLVMLHMLALLANEQITPLTVTAVEPILYFSEAIHRERETMAGRPWPMPLFTKLRYLQLIWRDAGNWRRLLDGDGTPRQNFLRWAHRFPQHRVAGVAKRWPANIENAVLATKRYSAMLRLASPPIWQGPVTAFMTAQHRNSRFSSLHCDALKHCMPNHHLVDLPVARHNQLFTHDLAILGTKLREVLEQGVLKNASLH